MLRTAQFVFLFSAALAADESFDTELHDFELKRCLLWECGFAERIIYMSSFTHQIRYKIVTLWLEERAWIFWYDMKGNGTDPLVMWKPNGLLR